MSAMRTQLARDARANELGHAYAELEGDPDFAADAKKYESIYIRDWEWQGLIAEAADAVKQHLFELDARAPDLMDQYFYWKEVAHESRAELRAAQLLLSKIPGLLAATYFRFELAVDRFAAQEDLASESDDGEVLDNHPDDWVDHWTDDEDAPPAATEAAPAAPHAEPEATEDGNETDEEVIISFDSAAPVAEPVPELALALVQAHEQALVQAGSESLSDTPPALFIRTQKIRKVLEVAGKLELEYASTCKKTTKLSDCMDLLRGGTAAEQATAFTAALCTGTGDAGVFEAVQAALTHSRADLLKRLHGEIKDSRLHSFECIATEDPEGFNREQKLAFEKSVLSKVVTDLNRTELEIVICTRTDAATPHKALKTRIADLNMRRNAMVYQLSFVTDKIAGLSAPRQPMSVAAALALLALSPSVIRSDAPDEATHAVEAAYRTAALSCHPNRLVNADEETKAIGLAKCVSIGDAKGILLAHIGLLEAQVKALREAELKCAEAVDAAEDAAERKRPLDSLDLEPQAECFGDENEEGYASGEPPRKAARR
jgi:hypothetical protein